jgi:hypothetical protein
MKPRPVVQMEHGGWNRDPGEVETCPEKQKTQHAHPTNGPFPPNSR